MNCMVSIDGWVNWISFFCYVGFCFCCDVGVKFLLNIDWCCDFWLGDFGYLWNGCSEF